MSGDPSENDARRDRALALLGPALVLLATAIVLLPALGDAGVWTLGELAVLDRTLAALGEPRGLTMDEKRAILGGEGWIVGANTGLS